MEPNRQELPLAVAQAPVLRARELYRFFHTAEDETMALRGVSLDVAPGEFVALVGPSGSGKSTFLACVAGLDEPDGGHVEVAGKRLTRRPEHERAALRAAHFGIMLQSGNLFEALTIEANMRLQLSLARKQPLDRLRGLLDELGLADKASAHPSELSGGEAARAALAVALVHAPDVLLADEPTAEVDAATEERVLALFAARRRTLGATLIVTHSEAVARHADRVVFMQDGRLAG
jgi:putative ABC transport system ATP-binding protein